MRTNPGLLELNYRAYEFHYDRWYMGAYSLNQGAFDETKYEHSADTPTGAYVSVYILSYEY